MLFIYPFMLDYIQLKKKMSLNIILFNSCLFLSHSRILSMYLVQIANDYHFKMNNLCETVSQLQNIAKIVQISNIFNTKIFLLIRLYVNMEDLLQQMCWYKTASLTKVLSLYLLSYYLKSFVSALNWPILHLVVMSFRFFLAETASQIFWVWDVFEKYWSGILACPCIKTFLRLLIMIRRGYGSMVRRWKG
jgi:hypothetical protein